MLREDGEEEVAELAMFRDLSGEERSGGGERRRRRRARASRVREEEGAYVQRFAK